MTNLCPDCGKAKPEQVILEGEMIDPDCDCGYNWSEMIEKAKQHESFTERVCPKCDKPRGTKFVAGVTLHNRLCNVCGFQFHDTIKFYRSKIYMGIIDHNGLESFIEVGCSDAPNPEALYVRAEANEHRDAYAFMSEIPLSLAERVEKLFDDGKYKEAKKQLTLISLAKLDVDGDFKNQLNNMLGK